MAISKNAMGLGLKALNRFAGLKIVDDLGLRTLAEKGLYHSAHAGFVAASTMGRGLKAARSLLNSEAEQQADHHPGLFDLTPSEEQQMLREAALNFATEQLRPAALAADTAARAPTDLLKASADLGFAVLSIPEQMGGSGAPHSAVTNTLIAEAMAQGDLSLAVSCLAPSAVTTALSLWGDELQQAQYLPSFTGSNPPVAALAVQEPQVLFDPFVLRTTVARKNDGYVLNGVKSLVPRAAECEFFLVAAQSKGKPALFIVDGRAEGIEITPEPAMGLRAAATGRVQFRNVVLPSTAKVGTPEQYGDCIAQSRLAWCALATGCGQAMLEHIVPYANERIAFGEPISHRQAVAFLIADIAIELEGLRLATWRAASRADQGESFLRQTALARRLAADKGMKIGNDGLQILGGHGFTKEYPVERWYRDLRACGVMEGIVLV